MAVREAFGVKDKFFKAVKSHEEAVKEGRDRIEKKHAQLTHEDIKAALSESVLAKVTPLHDQPYAQ